MVGDSNFPPEEFLNFAEKILETMDFQNSEAAFRTTINRCYLSAVLKASQVLEPLQSAPFSESAEFYREVEKALTYRNAPMTCSKLGSLRSDRKNADYQLDKQINKNRARWSIAKAKDVFRLLEDEVV